MEATAKRTPHEEEQEEEEEYADAMLVKVLSEVVAIEAEVAAAEAAASASGGGSIDTDVGEALAMDGSDAIIVEDIAVVSPLSKAEAAVARAQESHVNPLADRDPSGLRFPSDAADIAAMALRHQAHHRHLDHVGEPPLSILPAIGACVLFFVLATWSQLRRSRRRAIEHHDDWMRDMDLMESAYREQTGPAGYLL